MTKVHLTPCAIPNVTMSPTLQVKYNTTLEEVLMQGKVMSLVLFKIYFLGKPRSLDNVRRSLVG